MRSLLMAIATGALSFAATNIDDIFVLTLFFSQVNARLRRWHVVVGQYIGIALLVTISLAGYFARAVAPEEWIGLLGLVPVVIGVKKIWEWRANEKEEPERVRKPGAHAVLTVAAVTFANGGDNIGIYTPLFATSDVRQLIIILSVFFVLVGVWCAAAYYMGNHPAIRRLLDRYGHVIVPVVFVALGFYIMAESGTLRLLSEAVR